MGLVRRLFEFSKHKLLRSDSKSRAVRKTGSPRDGATVHSNPIARTRVFDERAVVFHDDSRMGARHQRVINSQTASCTSPDGEFSMGEIHLVE